MKRTIVTILTALAALACFAEGGNISLGAGCNNTISLGGGYCVTDRFPHNYRTAS